MPKLILLVACEKVIIDQAQLPSLIGIFQTMKIQLQDAPLPENAISPTRWAIFSMWQHTPEETGIEYTQHIEILKPSGEKFGDGAITKFSISQPEDLQSKNLIEVLGLPINDEGFVKIRIWLEDIPDCNAEYQFRVKHLRKENNEQITPPTQVN
jgi:hypothetical protein